MKRLLAILCLVSLLSGCASMSVLSASSEEARSVQGESKTTQTLPPEVYPKVIVTPDGRHATVMPPCGNLAVVVNPDGSHSTALINGNSAIIVTP